MYLIRIVAPKRYQIAKFEDTKAPAAVYHVINGKAWWCTCPAGKSNKNCKHIQFVRDWIQRGEREWDQLIA